LQEDLEGAEGWSIGSVVLSVVEGNVVAGTVRERHRIAYGGAPVHVDEVLVLLLALLGPLGLHQKRTIGLGIEAVERHPSRLLLKGSKLRL
jgi:hypothetical protein